MRFTTWTTGILIASCASASSAGPDAGKLVVFEGTCDASGAVPIDGRHFALADDEDNRLRIYDGERGGPPLWSYDLTPRLGLTGKKAEEVDLEGASHIGDRAFWVGSHARKKSGKRSPARLLFITTTIPRRDGEMEVVGKVHEKLLDELLADPRIAAQGLAEAAERPPQAEGGLNIEGLTATAEGTLVLGFRNPIPKGRALLVPILNPLEISGGAPARFGDPITLDLGGRGIRALSRRGDRLLILAGSYAHERETRLYVWDGKPASAPRELGFALGDLNPEAFFNAGGRGEAMILSDDGALEIDGKACKKLKDPTKKRFRGLWVPLGLQPP